MRAAAARGLLALLAGVGVACGGGTAGPKWSAPVAIDQAAFGRAGDPKIEIDGAGNAVAVWERPTVAGGPASIAAIRFDTTTDTWGGPAPLEADDVADAIDADLDVGVAGDAVVVWRQHAGDYPSIWSSWFDAATNVWHGAALVEIDNTGDASKPCVAVLPGGGAVAVWSQWDGLRQSLWANQLEGAPLAWTRRALLETTDSADALEPDVAADPAGNAVAIWTESARPRATVWTSRREAATGAWGAPFMLGVTSEEDHRPGPRIALDPNGDGLAIWSLRAGDDSRLWASRFHAATGQWDVAAPVQAEARGEVMGVRLALDGLGNGFATWSRVERLSGYEIWAARFVAASGAWTPPVRLRESADVLIPSVAAAGDRHAVVMWKQMNGPSWDLRASHFEPRAETWGPPRLIDTADVGLSIGDRPGVAIDAAGNAIALFARQEGAGLDLRAAYHPF